MNFKKSFRDKKVINILRLGPEKLQKVSYYSDGYKICHVKLGQGAVGRELMVVGDLDQVGKYIKSCSWHSGTTNSKHYKESWRT